MNGLIPFPRTSSLHLIHSVLRTAFMQSLSMIKRMHNIETSIASKNRSPPTRTLASLHFPRCRCSRTHLREEYQRWSCMMILATSMHIPTLCAPNPILLLALSDLADREVSILQNTGREITITLRVEIHWGMFSMRTYHPNEGFQAGPSVNRWILVPPHGTRFEHT